MVMTPEQIEAYKAKHSKHPGTGTKTTGLDGLDSPGKRLSYGSPPPNPNDPVMFRWQAGDYGPQH
jgi:hypothetical protein